MRNGNGWALSINSTILGLLDVNPEVDMVKYTIENDKLIITKDGKRRKSISINILFIFLLGNSAFRVTIYDNIY